jgi:biopolymer transport protein TolQ
MADPVSTAVTGVDAANVAGTAAIHDFSIVGMFLQADWVVQFVMVMLLLASEALDKFYEKSKKRANHPMAIIFVAAMEEWFRSKSTGASSAQGLRLSLRERIVQVMQVSRNRELDHVESGLGFLATTGSSAPFIGLFGTVWGIMNSFHAIAQSKNTSLVAVAPGIAEALFATAIGLFAAIPAVIAYNRFSSELSRFSNKLDDFSIEFDTILSRQLEG